MKNLLTMLFCTACVYLGTFGSLPAADAGQQESATEKALVESNVKRGEKTRVEGLVVSRQGDVVTLRPANADDVNFSLRGH